MLGYLSSRFKYIIKSFKNFESILKQLCCLITKTKTLAQFVIAEAKRVSADSDRPYHFNQTG
jgi:hypothetical protein